VQGGEERAGTRPDPGDLPTLVNTTLVDFQRKCDPGKRTASREAGATAQQTGKICQVELVVTVQIFCLRRFLQYKSFIVMF